jgi:protein gp37
MLFNHKNVWPGTTVHDLDTRQRIDHVLEIDTEAAVIVVAKQPLRALPGGDIATDRLQFKAVWPIVVDRFPCAFHCHGRN